MLAIVVEIGKTVVENVEYYQLSRLGAEQITHCNNIRNTPSILHESCSNNESLYERLTNQIQTFQEDDYCVIDAREEIASIDTKSNFGN